MSRINVAPMGAFLVLFSSFLIQEAVGCTDIYKFSDVSTNVSVRTFDAANGRGFIRFSPAGSKHQSQVTAASGDTMNWTGKYASLSFDTYFDKSGPARGSDYVIAGVEGLNAAGLEVGGERLDASVFPATGADKLIDSGMLAQYLLDNFSSVDDALADLESGEYRVVALEVPATTVKLHYFLHDADGGSAIVEFADGAMTVIRNPDVAVLTDTPYRAARKALGAYVGFGGSAPVPGGADAASRFVRAAYAAARIPADDWQIRPVSTALSAIGTAAVAPGFDAPRSQWAIVTDLAKRTVSFRTSASPTLSTIDLDKVVEAASVESDVDLLRSDLAGDIGGFFNPTAGFSAVGTPSAPDYAKAESWRVATAKPDKPVDVFFVHPTTYFFPNSWNESLEFGRQNYKVDASITGQAGIFTGQVNVFAPHFRDAHIKALAASEADKDKAIAIAYDDVSKAFDYYLDHYNGGRPFILAGHSQGSNLLLELMERRLGDATLRKKLVAAYIIGWSVTADDIKAYPFLKMSDRPDAIGAIVSYNTQLEKPAYSIVRAGGIAVNPLSMTTATDLVPTDKHLGAVFFDDEGKMTEMAHYTDAQAKNGAAVVSEPLESDIVATPFKGFYHSYDYAIFYRNLQKNVGVRIKAYLAANP